MSVQEIASGIANNAETVVETSAHGGAFYLDPAFWVGTAFVMVIVGLYKPVHKAIMELIEKRITRIKNEFKEAEDLKLEAQKLYAEYERKYNNVAEEVASIVAEQNEVIEETKESKIKELNKLLTQKQKELDGKIELAFSKVNSEINTLVSNRTMDILQQTISSKLTKSDYNRLIETSIKNIEEKF